MRSLTIFVASEIDVGANAFGLNNVGRLQILGNDGAGEPAVP
jgi:hypothetical protein